MAYATLKNVMGQPKESPKEKAIGEPTEESSVEKTKKEDLVDLEGSSMEELYDTNFSIHEVEYQVLREDLQPLTEQ